jgi:hypothetical protein
VDYRQMGGDAAATTLAALAALPERWGGLPDGTRLVAMHASLLGNRAGIYRSRPTRKRGARSFPARLSF